MLLSLRKRARSSGWLLGSAFFDSIAGGDHIIILPWVPLANLWSTEMAGHTHTLIMLLLLDPYGHRIPRKKVRRKVCSKHSPHHMMPPEVRDRLCLKRWVEVARELQ